jgi:hypothetical protein
MYAIRIMKDVDSERITLPELKPFIGRKVEIIVMDGECSVSVPSSPERSLAGSVVRYDDPFGSAVFEDDWEALR